MTVEQSLDMKTLLPCMGRSAVNWNGLLSCKGVQTSRPPLSKIWVFTLVAGSTHKVVKWMDWLIIVFKTELIVESEMNCSMNNRELSWFSLSVHVFFF